MPRASRSVGRPLFVVLLGCALMLGLGACGDGRVTSDAATDRIGEQGYLSGDGVVTTIAVGEREPAGDFSGPLVGGGATYNLADDLGKVVVLNVWGSWCPPCRKEAPALQSAFEQVDPADVSFIGVGTKDPSERASQGFIDEFGITYPNVYDPKGQALLAFRNSLPPGAIPSTLIVDREGRMAARVLGAVDQELLLDLVNDVLAEPAG